MSDDDLFRDAAAEELRKLRCERKHQTNLIILWIAYAAFLILLTMMAVAGTWAVVLGVLWLFGTIGFAVGAGNMADKGPNYNDKRLK